MEVFDFYGLCIGKSEAEPSSVLKYFRFMSM